MPATALKTTPISASQKALEKLGLKRDIDLALHLPLRYEDETRITKLRDARDGDHIQIEARVLACEVSYRPRRQLVVTVDDGSDTCTLRFFSFYPSQQKALAVGNQIRARGEIKGGFLGRTMLQGVTLPLRSRPSTLPWQGCPSLICAKPYWLGWHVLNSQTPLHPEI
jgi:ATP-dependent DNA helicase RecG